jgi:hypothetical protein
MNMYTVCTLHRQLEMRCNRSADLKGVQEKVQMPLRGGSAAICLELGDAAVDLDL